MRPAFIRDMGFLLCVALAQFGGLWTLPVVIMGAIGVTAWNERDAV